MEFIKKIAFRVAVAAVVLYRFIAAGVLAVIATLIGRYDEELFGDCQ